MWIATGKIELDRVAFDGQLERNPARMATDRILIQVIRKTIDAIGQLPNKRACLRFCVIQ